MERIRNNSLQLEDEISLHKKGWLIQRIGWFIMAVFVVASFSGLFGTGWLSHEKISNGKILVTFEKFGRLESPMKLEVYTNSKDGKIEIGIPRDYLTCIEVNKIIPAPESQTADRQAIVFRFDAKGTALITFYLVPEKSGNVTANLKVNGSDVLISHFIYP
jgi:hypothetical protein